jgi:hypothetical protein
MDFCTVLVFMQNFALDTSVRSTLSASGGALFLQGACPAVVVFVTHLEQSMRLEFTVLLMMTYVGSNSMHLGCSCPYRCHHY